MSYVAGDKERVRMSKTAFLRAFSNLLADAAAPAPVPNPAPYVKGSLREYRLRAKTALYNPYDGLREITYKMYEASLQIQIQQLQQLNEAALNEAGFTSASLLAIRI